MEGIREYLISVTAAALLCGVVKSLAGDKSGARSLINLVCGIFLALTVIRPLKEVSLVDLAPVSSELLTEARAVTDEGVDYARQAMARHITEECEAYIWDKAQTLGADIRVEIQVSREGSPVPVSSMISGELSPYARTQLKRILETDLGIPEEDQQWIP